MTMIFVKIVLGFFITTLIPTSWSMDRPDVPRSKEKKNLERMDKKKQLKNLNKFAESKERLQDLKNFVTQLKAKKAQQEEEISAPESTSKEHLKKELSPNKYNKIVNLEGMPQSPPQMKKVIVPRSMDTDNDEETRDISCLNYIEFLNIDELHRHGLSGKGLKIALIDSWFDYRIGDLRKALSESTFEEEPEPNSKAEAFSHQRVLKTPAKGHGNHLVSIAHTIAPMAKIRYINANERLLHFLHSHQENQPTDKLPKTTTVRDIHNSLMKLLTTNQKPDFVNISMKLPGLGDVDGPLNNDLYDPIHPLIIEDLHRLAENDIGIVIAFGNDGMTSIESPYLTHLVDLANDPQMKGRLILAEASRHDIEGERLIDQSNFVTNEESGMKVLTAPGYNILAIGPESRELVGSGTSVSAPIIAATAILLKQYLAQQEKVSPSQIHPEQVFNLMLSAAREKTNSGKCELDASYGQGILNPWGALKLAKRRFK